MEQEQGETLSTESVSVDTTTAPVKKFDWSFLKSTRFYAILFGAVSVLLIDPTFGTSEWYVSLGKFLGVVSTGFWGTRTLDRTVDKLATQQYE